MGTPILQAEHFQLFGRIVNGYARFEVELRFCLTAMTGMKTVEGAIVSAPYGAYQLNSVVKSVARLVVNPISQDRLVSLVDRWEKFTPLRTAVAHHIWRLGARPDSIRPTFIEVKSGHLKIKGSEDEDRDYTIPELVDLVNSLDALVNELYVFMDESGLEAKLKAERENMAAKIAALKEAKASEDGT